MDAYREATKKEHGYLLLDLHPLTHDRLRVRSSIFKPDELEIYSASGGLEEQSFDLAPSGYIKCGKENHPQWLSMAMSKAIQRAFKFFADCQEPRGRSRILSTAPDKIVKTICNAALNIERGDLLLKKKQKAAFKKHRKHIAKLTSKRFTIAQKRRFLAQKCGAFPIIPIVLSTALSAVVSALFNK